MPFSMDKNTEIGEFFKKKRSSSSNSSKHSESGNDSNIKKDLLEPAYWDLESDSIESLQIVDISPTKRWLKMRKTSSVSRNAEEKNLILHEFLSPIDYMDQNFRSLDDFRNKSSKQRPILIDLEEDFVHAVEKKRIEFF